jgi:prepilin-type N-terminal cleavage/methylation domain-containing protein
MRGQRGFSIAEVLTVLVIVGLALSVIAFAIPLILKGPTEAQSQVDNVQSAALALYKMQHDARPSTIKGVFSCSTTPMVFCSAPPPPLTQTQAVVLVTANGTGQFMLDSKGNPNWSGYIVYWLTPNADGSSNELRRAFVPLTVDLKNGNGLGQAVAVLITALGLTSYTTVAQDVQTMSAAVDQTNKIVDLQITGGDKFGNKSSLQLAGNSYVRN